MENDISLGNQQDSTESTKQTVLKCEPVNLSVRELISHKPEPHDSVDAPVEEVKSTGISNDQVIASETLPMDSNNAEQNAIPAANGQEEIQPDSQPTKSSKIVEVTFDEEEKPDSNQTEDATTSTTPKKTRRAVNTVDSVHSTYGTGTMLSSIPHIVEFVELNEGNESFLKMVRRLMYGTIGSKHQRATEIVTFNGLPKVSTSEEEPGLSNLEVLLQRMSKLTTENVKALAHFFNVPFDEEKSNEAEVAIVDFILDPKPITESIVKPYVIPATDSDLIKTPTSTRKRKAPASDAQEEETPSKRSNRRGRPRKNLAEDSTGSEDELSEYASPVSTDTPSGKRGTKRTSTPSSVSAVEVPLETPTGTEGLVENGTPVKRGRGRPPKSVKTPQSVSGEKESQSALKNNRSSMIHSVE